MGIDAMRGYMLGAVPANSPDQDIRIATHCSFTH